MKPEIASENVGFRLTPKELEALKRYASTRRWTLSQSVRIIVREFLDEQRA
jgi:hypothetical protein